MKPNRISVPFKIKKPILALGPQTKNTVCFAERNSAYVSPLHQDLSDPEDLRDFERSVRPNATPIPSSFARDGLLKNRHNRKNVRVEKKVRHRSGVIRAALLSTVGLNEYRKSAPSPTAGLSHQPQRRTRQPSRVANRRTAVREVSRSRSSPVEARRRRPRSFPSLSMKKPMSGGSSRSGRLSR